MPKWKPTLLTAILTLDLAIVSAFALPRQSDSNSPAQPVARISFVLFHNRVYLPVEVNGHETFEMVLDTGAAMSGLSEAAASAVHLRAAGKAELVGNGESRLKIALAKDVTFRLGGAELPEKSVAIVPYADLEEHEGRRISGVLGVSLFRRYVVMIDYPTKTLSLYQSRDFVYSGPGDRVPLRLPGAALFKAVIELPDRDFITCNLAVDLGTYSALRLYRPFLEKHHLVDQPGIDSFGFGLGGEFPERLGRVSALRIGSLSLKGPITSFSAARSGATSGSSYDGTIGGEVLRRFKVILDYAHQEMILEPGSDFSEPWATDTSGLLLRAGGADLKTISVLHVLTKTPAAAAGIKEGDVILSVDHQEALYLSLEGIRRLLTGPGNHRLLVRRGQRALEVDVTTIAPLD
jgi:Aspartyl protease/PDZ domain